MPIGQLIGYYVKLLWYYEDNLGRRSMFTGSIISPRIVRAIKTRLDILTGLPEVEFKRRRK